MRQWPGGLASRPLRILRAIYFLTLKSKLESGMARIQTLFRGNTDAYGTYNVPSDAPLRDDGKRKGEARTIREPLTEELWESHLNGSQGLGVIPIRDDSHCYWGCIDIDVYLKFDPTQVVDKIKALGVPLWVCRTKSGGCHVYVFFSEPTPAHAIRDWLKQIASALGYAQSEIFPKQTQIIDDDMGNWVNMPYFDAEMSTRYAINPENNESMTLEEFEAVCEPRPAAEWFEFKLATHLFDIAPETEGSGKEKKRKGEFDDAPPCLQILCGAGERFPEGSRNTGLLNMAIFRKKTTGSDEQLAAKVNADNQKYMGPGTDSEVQQIIRSIKKKKYEYTCTQEPLAGHCNRAECMMRKWGVAHHQATITGLQKIDSEPPTWLVQVDDQRVKLTTEALHSQMLFQRVVMEQINVCPIPRKPNDWTTLLRKLLEKVQVIEVPEEATEEGRFLIAVEDYILSATPHSDPALIHQGIPIANAETGRTYFKSDPLFAWMGDNGFPDIHRKRSHYFALMDQSKELNKHDRKRVAGKLVRLWSFPTPEYAELPKGEGSGVDEVPF